MILISAMHFNDHDVYRSLYVKSFVQLILNSECILHMVSTCLFECVFSYILIQYLFLNNVKLKRVFTLLRLVTVYYIYLRKFFL